jgi:hypothetical protein
MTLAPVTGTQHIQATAAETTASKQPAASKPQSAVPTQDTVHLSTTAQAQLSTVKAAAQEAAETPASTAKEAQSGDHQAQRLLANEAAAAKAVKGE